MSDQQSQTATAVQAATTSACPHPEAVGQRWGDPISEERQQELQGYLDHWEAETDHGERKGPFHRAGRTEEEERLMLSGADARWLMEQSGLVGVLEVPNLHLEGAFLRGVHLEGANLRSAHLEGADLTMTNLESAALEWAHLERAGLLVAHLEGARLQEARLEGADLRWAHLEGAHLQEARLEGSRLQEARLEGADLRNTWMDRATRLNHAALDRAALDQLTFDGTNLAVVKWETITLLGDEVRARATKDDEGKRKDRQTRLDDYEAAVRAHLQLAAVLRSQGMREQADRFSYRAQVLQRGYCDAEETLVQPSARGYSTSSPVTATVPFAASSPTRWSSLALPQRTSAWAPQMAIP